MKNWVVNNFWIKIISLILAIITWFYVNGELGKEERITRKFYKSSQTLSSQSGLPEEKDMNKGYITRKE